MLPLLCSILTDSFHALAKGMLNSARWWHLNFSRPQTWPCASPQSPPCIIPALSTDPLGKQEGEGGMGGIVLQGAQLRPTCLALGSFQGVVVGDPLWLTVINNNARRGIVHLVAMQRPLQLTARLGSLQGQESYDEPRGTNNTATAELRNKKLIFRNFLAVIRFASNGRPW